MRNFDKKKVIILIVILALIIGLGILLFSKLSHKEKSADTEQTKIAENIAINYIAKSTYGTKTAYNGIDLLFEKDKTTYEDLTTGELLTTAYTYAIDNLNPQVDNEIIRLLSKSHNMDNYSVIPGKAIRQAIKELFGKEFENQSYQSPRTFVYDYEYSQEFDVYLRKEKLKMNNQEYSISYKTTNVTTKDDKLFAEIAVAYVYYDNKDYNFSKDKTFNKIIYKDSSRLLNDNKLDEFNKYTITLVKKDNNYVFESIEKK